MASYYPQTREEEQWLAIHEEEQQREAVMQRDPDSKCELCGEPMPVGEEMFKFHGYSGPCPKPPLPVDAPASPDRLSERWQELFWALPSGEMRSKLRALEIDLSRLVTDRQMTTRDSQSARASSTPEAAEAPTSAPQDLRPWVQHKEGCASKAIWSKCPQGHDIQSYSEGKTFCDTCGRWSVVPKQPCTCGLDAALSLAGHAHHEDETP
jgi:hypothetical protein